MKRHTLAITLTAAALLLIANLSFAAEKNAVAPQTAAGKATASPANARVALVDINSASPAELMKLPGIGKADADKIVAGRPYATKANLVIRNIISMDTYQNLRRLVIAKQPYKDAGKNPALYMPKQK